MTIHTDTDTHTDIDVNGELDTRAAHLDALRAAVTGHLTVPGDAGWDAARASWQVCVDQQPAAVLEVADVADVVTAVRWGAEHGVAVSAQPVGHAATAALNGALILRTRGLNSILVDSVACTARVGAGVKWGELLTELEGTGLTGLVGSSPDPTVVGFTLAGGISWFGRAWGQSANNVLALDVVDPQGRQRRVTRDSDPELFWALRGGGGDFAIVTAVEIALFPAPQIYGGRLLWPVTEAPGVLRAFRDVAEKAPESFSIWAHIYHFPPLPDLPEPIRGKSFVSVAVAHLGSDFEAEQLLAPLRAVATPAMDTMGPVRVCEMGSIADEPVDPMPAMEHSMLLRSLDDAAIDQLVQEVGADSNSPLTVVQIRQLGGALAEARPDQGAAGFIPEPFQLFALGVPVVPDLPAAIAASFERLDGALAGVRSHRLVQNFVGREQDRFAGWSPEKLYRLRQLKQQRDPLGTIRSNKPVLP